ncbi:MAG: 5-formyltetrahydrofolate cyclo-ligase [Lachnospiraceae bacterium]|nr:5-formyltetrahydrofolate cyclo-ligase [Lachnospiraceae bacterium]
MADRFGNNFMIDQSDERDRINAFHKEKLAEAKKRYRKEMMRARDGLTANEVTAYGDQILEKLKSSPAYVRAGEILLYASYRNEVPTAKIFAYSISMGKRVYYPKVENNDLVFTRVRDLRELEIGFKGIPEPPSAGSPAEIRSTRSVIICPGLGFGMDGSRIGYGRGYYDRFLSGNLEVYRIGICFEVQFSDSVPHGEEDLPMNEVITEKHSYRMVKTI